MTEMLVRTFIKRPAETADPEVRQQYGTLAGFVGICCNLLLCIGKFTAGMLFGSVAIAADAVNNLSDASSSIVTLLGFKLAAKPADEEHPFGHARIEYLSGLTVAVMIIVIGIELVKTSVEKILHPEAVTFSLLSVAVLAASILLKCWMAAFNRSIGRRICSASLEATAADSRNDVVATTAVLVATVAEKLTGLKLDGYMGLAVAAFILWSGMGIVKDTVDPLLGEAPDEELVHTLHRQIMSYEGVLGMHDLLVHDYGPGRRFASAHVEMSADADVMLSHDVIDDIERAVLRDTGVRLTLHFDPINVNDTEVADHRVIVLALVREISPELSIHDFRMVNGPQHTNLIFDVLCPSQFLLGETALKEEIFRRIQENDPTHFAVVTIDHSFTRGNDLA